MTEPDDRETRQALRDMLDRRVGALTLPEGLTESVRRRHRRRQRAVLGSVLVLATVAVAVPAVALADRPATRTAVDRPTDGPTAQPTGPPERRCVAEPPRPRPTLDVRLPVQREAPGSLGRDAGLVAAVLRAGWLGTGGDSRRLDPATARVRMAHEVEGQVVGVVTASDTGRRTLFVMLVQGPDADHLVGQLAGGAQSSRPVPTTFDGGDAFVRAIDVCGRRHVIAAAPPGTTGRASWTTGIAPDLRPERTEVAMPMRADGIGTVRVESNWDRIRLVRAGRVLFDERTNGVEASPGLRPTEQELDRVAAEAPGDGDPVHLRTFVQLTLGTGSFPVAESDRRVLWSGRAGRSTVALATSELPNGVRSVSGSAAQAGGLSGYYGGLLRPGALERTVLAYRAQIPGRPLVAFAIGGVRAEAVLGDGTVARFALSGGGGVLKTSAAISRVRVYGADDRLIGEQVPDRGLTPVPYETPI